MSKLIKVRVRGKSQLSIHNDLGDIAFYFWQRINQRFEDGDCKGLAL